MKILNLTQHDSTQDQYAAGVVEPADKSEIKSLLTFNHLPSLQDMTDRAEKLAHLSEGYDYVMVGGAPYFMSSLEKALKAKGITPLYAFSQRECVEVHNPDGSVSKTFIFKHEGFVEV